MEQKNPEKQAPLSDDALDAVSGGLGVIMNDVYCPFCGIYHEVRKFTRRPVLYDGQLYSGAEGYICERGKGLFFKAIISGDVKYFDHEDNLI